MSEPITVTVTAENIANGKPGDINSCPIALALEQTCADGNPAVRDEWGEWYVELWSQEVRLPWQAAEFASSFDSGEKVEPFTFELPALESDEWEERCCECNALGDPARLDNEGYCPDCTQEKAQP